MHELWDLAARLRDHRWVDLTHAFHPGQPAYAEEERETVERIATVAQDGYATDRYGIVGQWGTHVDAPAHFIDCGATLDQLSVRQMVLPLAVLDVREQVAAKPDYAVNADDVRAWEARHGRMPENSLVVARTDWSRRWGGDMYAHDADGRPHAPGWGLDALQLLDERGVAAIGHETMDADPVATGRDGDDGFTCQRWWLGRGKWLVELLTGLDAVPEASALAVAAWPKPLGGTGFPARVVAILPG